MGNTILKLSHKFSNPNRSIHLPPSDLSLNICPSSSFWSLILFLDRKSFSIVLVFSHFFTFCYILSSILSAFYWLRLCSANLGGIRSAMTSPYHLCIHSHICPSHPASKPFIHLFIHLSIHLWIHPFIHHQSNQHLPIHSFIHSSIHMSTSPSNHPYIYVSSKYYLGVYYVLGTGNTLPIDRHDPCPKVALVYDRNEH